jgi:ribulose kinase
VLLGGAILAASASGICDIKTAMSRMCNIGETISPDPSTKAFHEAKYTVFKEQYND